MTALKVFLQFVLRLLVVSLILVGAHYLMAGYSNASLPIEEVFKIHFFLVAITMLTYGMLVLVGKLDSTKIGFTFLGLVLAKMVISFAYLYPLLVPPAYDVNEIVFNFFAAYLLYLFFEVREAYILIQKGPFAS